MPQKEKMVSCKETGCMKWADKNSYIITLVTRIMMLL